ncbi:response regulator transcription factor [Microbacterium sp. VKM Ac-2870]|uniref:response regulator n=1 Tax=Microbacterium sp. VKM Ac-2870 TaxID=2783825 RepID=UPI00188AD435|nr:response regulator transcription factor [Microbacterium sp. VKM Ac-2870]MBF4562355.1 response regulator transcription factor [Microbacterium sp. VKM Ac-2870]
MNDPVRVLLVDDHAVMRAGFRMILEAQTDITVVGEASTGAEAMTAASALHPDVICMDVQMPDMDGLEATRRIVADPSTDAVVVIVTTFDRDDYLFQALHAGASGFLLKNAGPEELITAVRVAAAGEALLAPAVTRRVIAKFASSTPDPHAAASGTEAVGGEPTRLAAPRAPLPVELTERETEVLRLLAEAHSNAEIASALYIGEATVKTHVSNVLQKLGARDRVAAVVYAHRHGLT